MPKAHIVHRERAAFNAPSNDAECAKQMQHVHDCMSTIDRFKNPPITYEVFQTQIGEYLAATAAVKRRAPEAVPTRVQKRETAMATIRKYEHFVEELANADPPNAVAIILESGFSRHKTGGGHPQEFTAEKGPEKASVLLKCPTGAHSYGWRHSIDGQKTWLVDGQTGVAHTVILGLPVGVEVWFCYQDIHAHGADEWSDPISFIIH